MIKAGILGATGMVGQRFIELLDSHPWFKVTEVAASEASAGKAYREAVAGRWKLKSDMPQDIADMQVKNCAPNLDCDVVFSALDSSVAGPIEEEFAKKGYAVFSNAKNHRMEPDVPLLIPEVNASHLSLIENQKKNRGWEGLIVTNPNCTAIGLAMSLAPLHQRFGVRSLIMTSMQALSGAGYPGVPSMDISDNVIPFISGEEEKVESEILKLLGSETALAECKVSAHCNRVAVVDGHLESVSLTLNQKTAETDIIEAWKTHNPLKELHLPIAPENPIIYMEEADRPQPRLDRDAGNGMAAVVGRLREDKVLGWKYIVLSHNTIRGAAGCSVLNAELLKAKGYLG